MFVRVLRKPNRPVAVRNRHSRRGSNAFFFALFRYTLYGLLGCALEIVFYNLVRNFRDVPILGLLFQFDWRVDDALNLSAVWSVPKACLYGQCSLWMFLVYGVACFAIEWTYANAADVHILVRALVYGLLIFFWECLAGWILFALTGYKIWFYADAGSFFEMTSFLILPIWCLTGLIVEYLYRQLMDPDLVYAIETARLKPEV
jgi:hypothetical protein